MEPTRREALILAHLPLTHRLCRRFPRAERDDAVQVACEALVRAVDAWDGARPFDRLASTTIVHALRDYMLPAWRRREVASDPVPDSAVAFEDDFIECEMAVIRRVLLAEIRAALPPHLAAALDARASGNVSEYARRHHVAIQTMHDRWQRAATIARNRLLAEDAA